MKTHYIDAYGEVVIGTHQYPANSGFYLVILSNGRTSVEPYTVAFGWNRFMGCDVMLSSYLKPLSF
jgi:hypothetical protein